MDFLEVDDTSRYDDLRLGHNLILILTHQNLLLMLRAVARQRMPLARTRWQRHQIVLDVLVLVPLVGSQVLLAVLVQQGLHLCTVRLASSAAAVFDVFWVLCVVIVQLPLLALLVYLEVHVALLTIPLTINYLLLCH